MKIAVFSIAALAAVLFAFAGHWLANRDGYLSGGLCIALAPVCSLVGGFVLRDWLSDAAAKLNPLALVLRKFKGG